MAIGITEEEYNFIYAGLPVPPYSLLSRDPKSDEDVFANLLPSKLWRLNNLYVIVNKEGVKQQFVMNYAQHIVYSSLIRHPRLLVLKSRQQGISTLSLILYLDDAVIEPDLNIGMQSYGLEESQALFERLSIAYDNIPDMILEFLNINIESQSVKKLVLNNKSTIRIQTSFRGSTLHRLHVSELGKISNKAPKKAKELKTGTLQSLKPGNYGIIESTAEGRYNEFYYMWEKATSVTGERDDMEFLPVFLSWVDDPDCFSRVPCVLTEDDKKYFEKLENDLEIELTDGQKYWAARKRIELGDEFSQEYPYSPEDAFAAIKDGSYYGKQFSLYSKVVDERLWDPNLGVITAWDIGLNDFTVVTFWQVWAKEIRLIDYIAETGEGIDYFAAECQKKPYRYVKHFFPHDIAVREWGAGAKSRLKRAKELGFKHIVKVKRGDVSTGIEMTRAMLPALIVDGTMCSGMIKAFFRYTKEWDDERGVFKDRPYHDMFSDYMDSVRTFAMAPMIKTLAKSAQRALMKDGGSRLPEHVERNKKKGKRRDHNLTGRMAF